MFERIGDKFIDDEPERDGRVYINNTLRNLKIEVQYFSKFSSMNFG